MRALLVLAVLLGACEVDVDPDPACDAAVTDPLAPEPIGTRQAVRLVWWERFAATDSPPAISWYEDLDSLSPTLRGRYCSDRDRVDLARRSVFPSGTSLTHELLHAYLQRRDGRLDPEHLAPEWEIVDATNRWLAAEGL